MAAFGLAGPVSPDTRCTAFLGERRIAAGELRHVALHAAHALEAEPGARLRIFDDLEGRELELDLRGGAAQVVRLLNRGQVPLDDTRAKPRPRGRGRPRLGVVAREVTLLPRHWQWLNAQPGGASLALRSLLDAATGESVEHTGPAQAARQRAWRFIHAMASAQPGFEDAARALFAGDAHRFDAETAAWPDDLREHAAMLAADAWPH
ncbi:DUF2239 family protein [Luteimonas sp. e5]